MTHCRAVLPAFSIIVIAASSPTACRRPQAAHVLSPAEQARWESDSAEYVRQVDQWRRDSSVIDSIARTINTDSLRSLYRAVWNLPHAAAAMQELICEQTRLSRRFGAIPAGIAQEKVQRQEWGTDQKQIDRHLDQRMPSSGTIEISNERCHLTGARGPDSLNGTSLNFVSPRPTPPRRPGERKRRS